MTNTPHALAVIDGSLCQLNRFGQPVRRHGPLATAVVDFLPGPMCTYVRELSYGLLPGLANLYCVDGAFRLQWMAEWPSADDPCAEIVSDDGETLTAMSVAGATVRLASHSGRLLSCTVPVAAAS